MSKFLQAVIIILVFTLGLFSCSKQEQESHTIRIMPLGDSITHADSAHPGYRYPLWKLLKEGGYDFDFVGTMKMNHKGPNPQSFDTDHEGHWGWRADQILHGVPGYGSLNTFLTSNTPDIVLMHLGSNDIFQGESVPQIIAELKEIITVLNSANSKVIILIAQILPTSDQRINRRISQLNKAISDLPSEMDKISSRIIVVNQHAGFNPYQDTYDGVHPNSIGEGKMAKKWFKALQSVSNK